MASSSVNRRRRAICNDAGHGETLDNLAVVLLKTRFPENVGMAARACVNMGCKNLILIQPERWDPLKAEPLATPKGMLLIKNIRLYDSPDKALAPFNLVVGTTARTGGVIRKTSTPETVAAQLSATGQGKKIALLFGPEDRGLTNAELCSCQALMRIPTASEASSLNLAQAVLLALYEFRKQGIGREVRQRRLITQAERSLLEQALRETLLDLDWLPGANPDHFFQLWRNLLARLDLARHEYDALMGFCRQIKNHLR